jgi:ankyrin repeat protein
LKAAFFGHIDIIRALFQAGADVDDADIYGVTALMIGIIVYF